MNSYGLFIICTVGETAHRLNPIIFSIVPTRQNKSALQPLENLQFNYETMWRTDLTASLHSETTQGPLGGSACPDGRVHVLSGWPGNPAAAQELSLWWDLLHTEVMVGPCATIMGLKENRRQQHKLPVPAAWKREGSWWRNSARAQR